MADVSLDLDPAMIDNMRREAEEHGFEALDGYVEWLLEHRETVLAEHDVWDTGQTGSADPDADLSQSPDSGLGSGLEASDRPSLEPEGEPAEEPEDADLPEEEDGADDDEVAEALKEIDIDEEED